MPVTLAHPAAVLPLRGLGLPLAAMVIGAMVPDLPLFTRWLSAYWFTHSWTGVVTADLAITLLLLAFWDRFGRDALVDTAPALVRDRLPAQARIGRRAWLLAPVAAVIGSASHVVWDAFTHSGRWGVRNVAWLHEQHGPLRGDAWAQHASGVLGLVVVGLAMAAHLRRHPAGPSRPRRLPAATLPVAFATTVLASAATGLTHLAVGSGLHLAAFWAAVAGIIALGALVIGLGVAWALAPAAIAPEVSDPVAP
ncbi:DUF4184 family protein [Nocardioides ginsengisoli]|uniref:DUF4184 family protein n=1 Tax=Nocardioides ginsengisoli TaxID=363868 RepID=A0ABW3W573_9ACTN